MMLLIVHMYTMILIISIMADDAINSSYMHNSSLDNSSQKRRSDT